MRHSITQGIHTCDVACAHLEMVVGRCHAASAKGCKNKGKMCVSCKRSEPMVCSIIQALMHGLSMCASGNLFRPMTCNINQGIHSSSVPCAHQLCDFSRGLSVSYMKYRPCPLCIGKETSSNKRQQKQRPARISCCVYASPMLHRLWPTNISLAISTNDRQHQPTHEHFSSGMSSLVGDIGISIHISKRQRRQTTKKISYGLHILVVGCAYQEGDINIDQW